MEPITDFTPEDTGGAKLEASAEGIAAFAEARFGLSVHWGLYAINGRGEWVMSTENIPFETYRERVPLWNPTRFNADEWADLMVEAGQKFLIITTKHHDGFSMWDTALCDFKITNTPFGRDALAELAVALANRGITLCYYYSLLDWTHPAYRNDWDAYVEYYQGQLRELFTNYGRIGAIAFDGYWPRFEYKGDTAHFAPGGPWDLAGTYDLIHSLQPGTVIMNNHHILPTRGEDAQVWELDLPGETTFQFNTSQIGDKLKVVWWNVNSGWSYTPAKHNVKPAEELLASLKKVREKDAVFMLNVGPRPFGDIHPDEARVLREMGRHLRAQGTS